MSRNRVPLLLAGLILASAATGCVSFRVKAVAEVDNQVEEVLVCGGVEESGGLLVPVEVRTEFTLSETVIGYVRLRNVASRVRLRWRWYGPPGEMVRDSGYVSVNEEENFLGAVTAYDELEGTEGGPSAEKGEWTVAVYLNDILIGSRAFLRREDRRPAETAAASAARSFFPALRSFFSSAGRL